MQTSQAAVAATDLLGMMQSILQRENSKLCDLPHDVVIIDNCIGDVTTAHLKCSIAVTAGRRARKYLDQTGKSDLDDEDLIKRYLFASN